MEQAEQDKKTKGVNNRRNLIIIFCILGLTVIYDLVEEWYIQKNGVYIISTIHAVRGVRGGMSFSIRFCFRNHEYSGYIVSGRVTKRDEGSRFFIKILPDNPDRFFFTGIEVPYDITEAPPGGWKELPVLEW